MKEKTSVSDAASVDTDEKDSMFNRVNDDLIDSPRMSAEESVGRVVLTEN